MVETCEEERTTSGRPKGGIKYQCQKPSRFPEILLDILTIGTCTRLLPAVYSKIALVKQ